MTTRTPPHSIEAEESLLSSCLLDGNETIARCLASGIHGSSFYAPKHNLIFSKLHELYVRDGAADISILAEELRSSKQLDGIGGYPYLMQVSERVPTTAQAQFFIDKVKTLHSARELIRLATNAIEETYEGQDVPEIITKFSASMDTLQRGESVFDGARSFMDFDLPPEDDESTLLGRNRYIGRGDSALFVSSSGMGKSSGSFEWAALAAMGRPFVGIETKRPLTSLFIQAEDSDGDVGEVAFSLKHTLKLTPAEIQQVRERVIVIRDKVSRGDAFIAKLRILVEKYKPDLVWLNPLHAYAGCDIADAKEMGRFLREGLNKANRHERFAYMIVHHTPKPMTGKGVQDKKWHEFMYDAAGSAELVNWARAVLTLKPTEVEGDFNLILAKRGKRAGVTQEVEGAIGTFLEVTTKIPLRHSTEKLEIEGRKHAFNLIKWVARDPDAVSDKPKGKFADTYDDGDILSYFPSSAAPAEPFAAISRFVSEGCGMSKATFARRMKKLQASDLVKQDDTKRYTRTSAGDLLADQFLKTQK